MDESFRKDTTLKSREGNHASSKNLHGNISTANIITFGCASHPKQNYVANAFHRRNSVLFMECTHRLRDIGKLKHLLVK